LQIHGGENPPAVAGRARHCITVTISAGWKCSRGRPIGALGCASLFNQTMKLQQWFGTFHGDRTCKSGNQRWGTLVPHSIALLTGVACTAAETDPTAICNTRRYRTGKSCSEYRPGVEWCEQRLGMRKPARCDRKPARRIKIAHGLVPSNQLDVKLPRRAEPPGSGSVAIYTSRNSDDQAQLSRDSDIRSGLTGWLRVPQTPWLSRGAAVRTLDAPASRVSGSARSAAGRLWCPGVCADPILGKLPVAQVSYAACLRRCGACRHWWLRPRTA
jgi:hypothetical protein